MSPKHRAPVLPYEKPRWPLRPLRRHRVSEPFLLCEPFHPAFKIAPDAAVRNPSQSRLEKVFFLGVNLLGDMLCTTPVVRSYRRAHPDAFITYITHNASYCRVLDANPDIDQILYSERLYLEGEKAFTDETWLRSLPMDLDEPSKIYRFNIHEVCRSRPDVFQDSIAAAFSGFVGIPIDSARPVVRVTDDERRIASAYIRRRPYVVFCTHSTTKVIGREGELTTKAWQDAKWRELAEHVGSTIGLDILAVGAESDKPFDSPHVRSLHGLPIKVVAALLQGAACVVTVESGLMHLCHAVDAPMAVIFSRFVPLTWSNPREASSSRILYGDPAKISAGEVIDAVESILSESNREAKR